MIFNNNTDLFLQLLSTELENELPGIDAHLLLAPEARFEDIKSGRMPENPIESAVLILLYVVENKLFTAVILRNEYDGAHSGQISLPGGKREKTDTDFMHTAIREANEEIGVNPDKIHILGQLSRFYVRPSNFIVYPIVAFQSERPSFIPDPSEVQRVIEIDIFSEIDYSKIIRKVLNFKNNIKVTAPGFEVGGEFMWGATAMILSELIQVLTDVKHKIGTAQ